MRVPLGVVGIIYEARPNVTVDAASLCIKSGNATILRGGSEAISANQAIAACLRAGLAAAGLPETAVQVIETTDRAAVGELITMPQYVDVIVPRGGKGLIERISREAKVPVIKHLDGICHVYIDDGADLEKAFRVAINAKTPALRHLQHDGNVTGRAERCRKNSAAPRQRVSRRRRRTARLRTHTRIDCLTVKPATEEDWRTEYLAPILSIRIVDGIDQAIDHINTYSSQHTDSIITEDYTRARRFLREVDSSSVMVNASTRFADGFEYGLGAEIGISTDKIHARGPVGLEGLTSQKYRGARRWPCSPIIGSVTCAAAVNEPAARHRPVRRYLRSHSYRSSARSHRAARTFGFRRSCASFPATSRRIAATPAVDSAARLRDGGDWRLPASRGWCSTIANCSRAGPSYTIDTLIATRAEIGADKTLALVMGVDAFAALDSWHRWRELLDFAHIVVMERPAAVLPQTGAVAELLAQHRGEISALRKRTHGAIVPFATAAVVRYRRRRCANCSRRAIRRAICCRMLVWTYIREHRLYGVDASACGGNHSTNH